MDTISHIDWSTVGPLLGLFLCATIFFLAISPLFFRWLFKKEDHEAKAREDERRRDAEREAKTQDALLEFLRGSLLELGKVSGSLDGVQNAIRALNIEILSKIDASEKTLMDKLEELLVEIRDQKDTPKSKVSVPKAK